LGEGLSQEVEKRDVSAVPDELFDESVMKSSGKTLINAPNLVNLRIFQLTTMPYHCPISTQTNTRNYDLEVMKTLKAMQAQVASFWETASRNMIQGLIDHHRFSNALPRLLKENMNYKGSDEDVDKLKNAAESIIQLMDKGSQEDKLWSTAQELDFLKEEGVWPSFTGQSYNDLVNNADIQKMAKASREFPANMTLPIAGQISWKRLCSEFLFVTMNVAMQEVSDDELYMAMANTGVTVMAGPQEILTKLTLHRLQGIGRSNMDFFRKRMRLLLERDFENALRRVEGQVKSKIPSNRLQWIKDIFLGASDRDPSYSGRVLDALCESLDNKFTELCPIDFTMLNGRMAFKTSPLGLKAYSLVADNVEGTFSVTEKDKEETRSGLEKMWKKPLREFWNVDMKIEKKSDGLQLDTETHLESYRALRSSTSEAFMGSYAEVNNIDAFHDAMLRLHKAMHTAAIDYLRPKLRGTMAAVYQEESCLRALQAKDFKISFKEKADEYQRRADDLKEHLTTMQSEMKAIGLEAADFKPDAETKANAKRNFTQAFG